MYKHKWVSNYKLALAMGTCHPPLQGLNHVLLQLLALNPPEKTSGWKAEMRPPVLSIDSKILSGDDFMRPILVFSHI